MPGPVIKNQRFGQMRLQSGHKSLMRRMGQIFTPIRFTQKRNQKAVTVIGTATAQASAPLLWGTGAELAVAGTGDGAGWAEAGCGA
jgi:hypothetical protein